MAYRIFTTTLLFLLLSSLLHGQTNDPPVLPPKCHHAPHDLKFTPLTPQQRNTMLRSEQRSDSFDIINYNIVLEIIDFDRELISGHCDIRITPLMNNLPNVTFDLEALNIDSVTDPNGVLAYSYDDRFLRVRMPINSTTDTTTITVYYNGSPTVDPTGFGGLDFNDGYAYNLGIGLGSNPYNFGRSWFPCFDNFVERSTYDFQITTANGRKAYCIGTFLGETAMGGDTIVRAYSMKQEIPTYQAGIAVSNYSEIRGVHNGEFSNIPTLLLSKPNDTTSLINSFSDLGTAIDVLEYWYGPYPWEQVGYVLTVRGAMEHPTLIAYPEFSGTGGPTEGQNRLMAHELCHHWWGDLVNGSTAGDMWFKEGNAEYGAHLFTERFAGKDAFLNQVKANHVSVMTNAHIDDDGYWQLSGIPFEHTYGTHTYYRGAAVMHNMRAYMGDSLFRLGQQAMLNVHSYSAVEAKQYQEVLTTSTGLDMSDFFKSWIFSPGYAAYEIDSMDIVEDGMEYLATVYIEQKRRAAPEFHENVPIELTFIDENWQEFTSRVMVSGPQSVVQLRLPFRPVLQIVNKDNTLNLAQINALTVAKETGNLSLPYGDFRVTVRSITDSALISVDHYWVAADPLTVPPSTARVSVNHFWRYQGIFPEGFDATGRLEFDGATRPYHDLDLVEMTEDSLILVYRPDASKEWREYPYYRTTNPIDDDKKGIIRLDSLLVGDYAFANGPLPLFTSSKEVYFSEFELFPNPANRRLSVAGSLTEAKDLKLELYDLQGRQVRQEQLGRVNDAFQHTMELPDLASGIYLLKLSDGKGRLLRTEKVEVLQD